MSRDRIKLGYGLLAAALVGVGMGCNPKPRSTMAVELSEVPADAKAVLMDNATITRAEKLTYSDGNTMFRLYYTDVEGTERSLDYNVIDPGIDTPPSREGVFESSSKK